MGKLLTPDEVNKKLAELKQRGIEMLSPYTKVMDKHTFKCHNHDYIWDATFDGLTSNRSGRKPRGCPECKKDSLRKIRSLSVDEIQSRIKELKARKIKLLSPFTQVADKHKFQCEIDDHIWDAIFISVCRGHGCPRCGGRAELTKSEVERRISELRSRNIILISPFTKVMDKHWFECAIDGKKWFTTFDSVYRRNSNGCNNCTRKYLTDDDRLRSEARRLIRKRLDTMFRRGNTLEKIYKNEDGTHNKFWYELSHYWAEQYTRFIKVNPKPVKGRWHLDHIVPFSWFDPYNLDEQKICWNAKNLQWLTINENSAKNDTIREIDLPALTEWHYQAIAQCSYPGRMPNSLRELLQNNYLKAS